MKKKTFLELLDDLFHDFLDDFKGGVEIAFSTLSCMTGVLSVFGVVGLPVILILQWFNILPSFTK